jgi:hypothetical protein
MALVGLGMADSETAQNDKGKPGEWAGGLVPAERATIVQSAFAKGRSSLLSFFPNQISAPAPSHLRRMHRPRRNIAPLARAIRPRTPIHRQRHFSIENDVRRLRLVNVLSVLRPRPILPHVRRRKPLRVQFSFERLLVNRLHNAFPFRRNVSSRRVYPAILCTAYFGMNAS